MKIRNGFVSNSSSSSFVIIGIRLNDKKVDVEKVEALKLDYDYVEGSNSFLVGKQLARWSDGECDVSETSFDKIQEEIVKLKPKLVELTGQEQPIKLFYGEIYG